MRIVAYSEDLSEPFDEGIKRVAHDILHRLAETQEILVACNQGCRCQNASFETVAIRSGFLCPKLWKKVKTFGPDVFLYIPSASMTLPCFVRLKTLSLFARDLKKVLLSLQFKIHSLPSRLLVRRVLLPDLVLAPSTDIVDYMKSLGCKAEFVPLGTDLHRFRDVTPQRKETLRSKYGLSRSSFVVLHVGHMNKNRGIKVLTEIQSIPFVQAVLVCSTSTPAENDIKRELARSNILCLHNYIPRIEELYQLSDCYLFPVEPGSHGSIETPLSVLEAMACNLPVVTTRFGALPKVFVEGNGLVFADTAEDAVSKVLELLKKPNRVHTREKVEGYSVDATVEKLSEQLRSLLKNEKRP